MKNHFCLTRMPACQAALALCLGGTAVSLAQDQSVRPGINQPYTTGTVAQFVGRFETESREIYTHRTAIAAACALKPGMTVADIGAGTGLFTRLFAQAVGPTGRVYAVDLFPNFVAHVEQTCREARLTNVTGVVCAVDDVKLPPASVDLAFICDTYHHFEFPEKTMATLHRALRPGGRLIMIDFERVLGTSSEFVLNHVRAGKEIFTKEIEGSGFHFVEEKPLLKENDFRLFRRLTSHTDSPKQP